MAKEARPSSAFLSFFFAIFAIFAFETSPPASYSSGFTNNPVASFG